MLEIIFLVKFHKSLAAIAKEKNRTVGWAGLGVILWITGEIAGAVLGAKNHANGMGLYGFALLGAVVGAVTAWVIVKSLTPIPTHPIPTARVV
jgi:hypothetical protein